MSNQQRVKCPKGGILIPANLLDTVIMVIFPPLYVFLHEYREIPRFKNISNIFKNLILTGLFYVPGLIHAYNLQRTYLTPEMKEDSSTSIGSFSELN